MAAKQSGVDSGAGGDQEVAAIAGVARILDGTRPLPEALNTVCEHVAGLSWCDFVTIRLAQRPGQRLTFWGFYGTKREYVEWAELQGRSTEPKRLPTTEAYRTGRPVAVTDLESDPRFPTLRPGARLQGYRGIASVPILGESQILGALSVYSIPPHEYTTQELDLLCSLGRLAGVAILVSRALQAKQSTLDEMTRVDGLLRERYRSLLRLSELQSRLVGQLAPTTVDPLQSVATELRAFLERPVLVAEGSGEDLAFAGDQEDRRRFDGEAPRSRRLIGERTAPLATIEVAPPIPDDDRVAAIALDHAVAVVAVHLTAWRADRHLRLHARPALLLAGVHGLLGSPQWAEADAVLGLRGARLRVAVAECANRVAAEQAARALRRAPLCITAAGAGDRVIALIESAGSAPLERLRSVVGGGAGRIGCSGIVAEASGLPAAFEQARLAMGAAARGGTARFQDLGPLAPLLESFEPGTLGQLADRVLGPLRAYDARHGAVLTISLEAYLRHQGSLREAATDLHVHPNTLQARLLRCAELTALDLHDFRARTLLALALQVDAMNGPATRGAGSQTTDLA